MADLAEPPRTLYRIIRTRHPSWSDFLSNMVRDQPPRDVEVADPLEWAGLSGFDNLEEARERATRFQLGRCVAELRIPDDAPVIIRPSVGPRHWSILGGAGLLLGCVVRVVRV